MDAAEAYFDLGALHRPVTTKSKESQLWFNRGLVWSYGFNHEEAAECFNKAIAIDPDCAMAYWGLAYALGPNYNKPWEFFDGQELESVVSRTHTAVEQAKIATGNTTPVEKALIHALEFRYPRGQPVDDCSIWNPPYAEAMREVYDSFPDDLDVAALYVDSLMNLTPWHLWDLSTGQPTPGSRTIEAKSILDRTLALRGGPDHPGLLHLYIHLMEMSPHPEVAMPIADRLRGLVPDAGHLQHMPSHLDILCGDYRRAIASNTDAVQADKRYLARAGPLNFYTLYRCHDLHFRVYAAMFAGQSKIALETVDWLEATLPEELLRVPSPPMADWLEAFHGMRVHVLIRFGIWQQILDLPLPDDQDLYCVTTALLHYAKGVAYAATGKVHEAEKERELLAAATGRVKSSRTLFNNTCLDILAIAKEMLNGELTYRLGKFDEAFAHLEQAITLNDALPYDEPWGWMQPPRHAYGALLLEQNHVERAAAVYRADLGFDDTLPRAMRHPNNVWALHGYHECLKRLGRHAEAGIVKPQLDFAVAMADIPIAASCFCRTDTI
jgi:tetratricopeptide (TPR) repeat protein